MENENKIMICVACEGEFSLTPEGQEIHEEYNLTEPKYCKQCSMLRDYGKRPVRQYYDRTDSTYWTPENLAQFGIGSKPNVEYYTPTIVPNDDEYGSIRNTR